MFVKPKALNPCCTDAQVEEIMLLNTTVQRWDGARCYYPNVMLNANPLINLTRSENKGDVVKARDLLLPYLTSFWPPRPSWPSFSAK